MGHELFGWAARRYDFHTPPNHYRHDHRFVLEELSSLSPGARMLDVGCGTGVFLDKVRCATDLEVFGIDVSEPMVKIARERVGPERIDVRAMQNLTQVDLYDALVSLSWSFNYCDSLAEASDILDRFAAALRPGGSLVLQVAHAPHATGELRQDCESGPDGRKNDVVFLYRFTQEEALEPTLRADYVYACRSLNELLHETHRLRAADVLLVAELAKKSGFEAIEIFDSWKREPFRSSPSPFLTARRSR